MLNKGSDSRNNWNGMKLTEILPHSSTQIWGACGCKPRTTCSIKPWAWSVAMNCCLFYFCGPTDKPILHLFMFCFGGVLGGGLSRGIATAGPVWPSELSPLEKGEEHLGGGSFHPSASALICQFETLPARKMGNLFSLESGQIANLLICSAELQQSFYGCYRWIWVFGHRNQETIFSVGKKKTKGKMKASILPVRIISFWIILTLAPIHVLACVNSIDTWNIAVLSGGFADL